MQREFQVVYRIPGEKVQTELVISHADSEARAMFESEGFKVIAVTQVRVLVDWEKPVWDRDEFAAAMSIKGGTLSNKKGDGKIPWSTTVSGVPRRVAMKWIENSLNEAGKKILDELRSE